MSLCVECLLKEQPTWPRRYRKRSLALIAYGSGVFLLPDAPPSHILQGLFFLVAFPWIVWPLFAASRADRCK